MTFAEALVSSMASWPGLRETLVAHDLSTIPVDSWRAAMRVGSSASRTGVYGDSGALQLYADKSTSRVACRLIAPDGLDLPGSPQIFLPRTGVPPLRSCTFVCLPDVHFMLEVDVFDASAQLASGTEAGRALQLACDRMRQLESEFRQSQASDFDAASGWAASLPSKILGSASAVFAWNEAQSRGLADPAEQSPSSLAPSFGAPQGPQGSESLQLQQALLASLEPDVQRDCVDRGSTASSLVRVDSSLDSNDELQQALQLVIRVK